MQKRNPNPKKKLPKGITKVVYENKDGRVVKWRVRIQKGDFSINKLFDDLDRAYEAVKVCSSAVGRSAIERAISVDENKVKRSEKLKDNLDNFYYSHYYKPGKNEVDKRNNGIYKNIISTICNTKVPDLTEFDNLTAIDMSLIVDNDKPLGGFDIFKIQSREISNYINARLRKGMAKSTITKEVGILSSFFNNYSSYFGDQYETLKTNNPCLGANKRKLKHPTIKRKRRLTEEEEGRLEVSLNKCRNKDMFLITALAIYTGMRRSEVLMLESSQIKKDYIILYRTKNGEPREIPLTADAKEVIKLLPKKEGRIFSYTIEGFKSNFKRVLDRAGISDFQFKDLRNEFISRILEKGYNSMVASELVNISNISYFEATHVKQHEDEQRRKKENLTQDDAQAIAGHKTRAMTKYYFRMKKD